MKVRKIIGFLCGLLLVSMLAMAVAAVDGGMGVVNPIKEYTSLAELEKAVDFKIQLPPMLPRGYAPIAYSTINGDLAQVVYQNDKEDKITYRVMRGDNDNSGDYTVFKKETTTTYDKDVKVVTKGSNLSARLAIWTADGLSYSLAIENGVQWKSMGIIMDALIKQLHLA